MNIRLINKPGSYYTKPETPKVYWYFTDPKGTPWKAQSLKGPKQIQSWQDVHNCFVKHYGMVFPYSGIDLMNFGPSSRPRMVDADGNHVYG